MSGTIRDHTIEEIKSRCNIVDVVGRVVPLKKTGSNHKGLCPFHNEKTPSFVVSESRQWFTCFGCGATGDAIDFVQRYYNLEFAQAVEKLAGECGVTLEQDYGKSKKKDLYYQINKDAATFYYKAFREKANPAAEYMKKRGMDPQILNLFGIGYADGEWDSLTKHLLAKGYETEPLLELGLISESKGKHYDKFRSRVMFPILSTGGKVIGFGGRALGDAQPKYLNSQESSVFLKKNNLYALNLTKQEIGKTGYGVLVEGYMDVIGLYQAGVRNATASLGTALTESQAKLLKRYTNQVVLSYDADEAGVNASMRAMEILHREDFRMRILAVPEGKDPDEYIKHHGKQAFLQLAKNAPTYADFKFARARAGLDLATTEGRLHFLREAITILKALSPVEADLYIRKLAGETGISEGAIRSELGREPMERPPQDAAPVEEGPPGNTPAKREQVAVKLILTDSAYLDKFQALDGYFISRTGRALFEALLALAQSGTDPSADALADNLEPGELSALRDIERNILLAGKEEQIYGECLQSFEEERLARRRHELILKISLADEQENPEEIRRLTEELMEIQKKKTGGPKK